MADRELKIITKKQAAEYYEMTCILPGEVIDKINIMIKKGIEKRGETSFNIDRKLVYNAGQWKKLQDHLKDAGWDVIETQTDGHFITIS